MRRCSTLTGIAEAESGVSDGDSPNQPGRGPWKRSVFNGPVAALMSDLTSPVAVGAFSVAAPQPQETKMGYPAEALRNVAHPDNFLADIRVTLRRRVVLMHLF